MHNNKAEYQEYSIRNKKIHVIDNAMPQQVVDRWINFYENEASFRRISAEYLSNEDTDRWLAMVIDLKMRYQIFDIESWLLPMVSRFDSRCTEKDFMRSYMNMCTTGDHMQGHTDTVDEEYNDDQFFVASLVFMNPYVKDPKDSGFEFEEGLYIENIFNRLVIFDGRIWHRAHVPTDRLVRLTMYNSFRKPRLVADYTKSKASWFR